MRLSLPTWGQKLNGTKLWHELNQWHRISEPWPFFWAWWRQGWTSTVRKTEMRHWDLGAVFYYHPSKPYHHTPPPMHGCLEMLFCDSMKGHHIHQQHFQLNIRTVKYLCDFSLKTEEWIKQSPGYLQAEEERRANNKVVGKERKNPKERPSGRAQSPDSLLQEEVGRW